MEESYELVLVSCLVESPSDRQQILSALVRLTGPQVYYLTSLAGAAIGLAVDATQRQKLSVVFSPQWDPKRSPLSISNYQIPNHEELLSLSQRIEAYYQQFDYAEFPMEESDRDYETRLREQIYRRYAGRIVVLTRPEVITTSMSLLGVGNVTIPPILSVWQIFPLTGTSVNTFTAGSYEELPLLFDPQGVIDSESPAAKPEPAELSGFALTESVVLEEPPARPLEVSVLLSAGPAVPPSSLFEQLFAKEVDDLCGAFTAQLGAGGVGATGGQAVGAVNTVVGGLRRTLAKQQEQVDKEAVDLGKEEAVLEEVQTGFRVVQEGQVAVELALTQLSDSLFPAIAELKRRIAALESVEANARQPALATTKLPLTIQSYSTKPGDLSVYLSISNRKLYPVWGYVHIYQGDVLTAQSSAPLSFQYLQELNVSNISPLQDGQYQVVIVHFLDKSPISNIFHFTVDNQNFTFPNRSYRYSCIYKSVGNIAEIEEALRTSEGDGAVQMLRQLAAQWQNEAEERVGEFLEIVKRGGGEQSIRKSLAERGFHL